MSAHRSAPPPHRGTQIVTSASLAPDRALRLATAEVRTFPDLGLSQVPRGHAAHVRLAAHHRVARRPDHGCVN